MNASNIPGFTAESSLYATRGSYRSASAEDYGSIEQGVVPQMSAGGPFSGSCECWPGACCCILCYFDRCVFWCWSNVDA
jgi:hypothetical protein